MSDPTAEFFAGLPERGNEPLLERTSGVLRFDLTKGKTTEHWLVTITKGTMAVSREDGPADCVVRTDKQLFDGIAQGEVNAMAALLRGAITITGLDHPHELEVLMLFHRLFPGPPADWKHERLVATGSGR
jgi:hypothetical protein